MARNVAARAGKRPGKRLSRGHDAAATREALLKSATQLFAERGFDAVTVADIAQQAGVNKALINYHFGGKLQLYRTIVRELFNELVVRVEPLRHDARAPGEVLRELIAIVGELAMTQRPHFPRMLLREVMAGGPHLDQEILAYPMRVFAVVRETIARGIQEGVFRPVDPILTHLSLVGSLVFFFATADFRRRMASAAPSAIDTATPDRYIRHLQELIARGLAVSEP